MRPRYYDLIICWACHRWKIADPGHKVCRECEGVKR